VRVVALTAVLLDNPRMASFCYTQLTGIAQECNGLYTDPVVSGGGLRLTITPILGHGSVRFPA